MRIACLQFAPQVGDINNNLNRADSVLSRANIDEIDLLVLPELAFSGYNFRSLQHISPYLEPTTSGITSLWARTTALKHNCVVIAGYPEKVDVSPKWPASPEYYNSAIAVNAEGETIANYRKSFLYYTDETWALEGPGGFFNGMIDPLGNVAMGICMDINPYKFEAPWNAWEFAHHILYRQANLVVLSMAWLTREEARSFSRTPKEPDMETLSYWLSRLEPLIRNEGEDEIICVFANRCGTEEEAVYAGTSAVLGIQAGEVKVYGILGRGDRELLVVDTSRRPKYQLIADPQKKSQTSTSNRSAHKESVPSSASSSAGSVESFKSDISISTGRTSFEPPASFIPPPEDDSVTSISPSDDELIQAYFDDEDVHEPPPIHSKPLPDRDRSRYPNPVPLSSRFDRPQFPRSRNCTRSRGPNPEESPLLGSLTSAFPENIRPTTEVRKTLEKVRQSLAETRSRTDTRPDRFDFTTQTRLAHSASVGASFRPDPLSLIQPPPPPVEPFESLFTRNYLGPRSRHTLPRPRSTVW